MPLRTAGVARTLAAACALAPSLPVPIAARVLQGVGSALLMPRMGALAARIGARLPLCAGPLVVAAGFLLALRIDARADVLWDVLPAILCFPAACVLAASCALALPGPQASRAPLSEQRRR